MSINNTIYVYVNIVIEQYINDILGFCYRTMRDIFSLIWIWIMSINNTIYVYVNIVIEQLKKQTYLLLISKLIEP